MTDILERMARAIMDHGLWPGSFDDPGHLKNAWDIERKRCRELARAALTAMREPTEAMVVAGCGEIIPQDMDTNNVREQAHDCWRAMIDAALVQEQPS